MAEAPSETTEQSPPEPTRAQATDTVSDQSAALTEKLDGNWQVSSVPEPKQYFSLDVSFIIDKGERRDRKPKCLEY